MAYLSLVRSRAPSHHLRHLGRLHRCGSREFACTRRNAERCQHVALTPVTIDDEHLALALAPVAVEPDWQRQGIGDALIRYALDECRRLGHGIVIVLGEPNYYHRFGFTPASDFGIECPFPVPSEAFMQQAMLTCALALINDGEVGWVEDPVFLQARNVLAFVGAKIVPRPVDREGLVIGKCSRQNSPRLILVTPSHQFPLGVTMSLKRRTALIEFADSRDGYILEDDYDSEFRFDGPPLPCLQGLDNTGRVIYTGTMSKILYPSLRLGFLVVPPQLVDTLVKIRAIMLRCPTRCAVDM